MEILGSLSKVGWIFPTEGILPGGSPSFWLCGISCPWVWKGLNGEVREKSKGALAYSILRVAMFKWFFQCCWLTISMYEYKFADISLLTMLYSWLKMSQVAEAQRGDIYQPENQCVTPKTFDYFPLCTGIRTCHKNIIDSLINDVVHDWSTFQIWSDLIHLNWVKEKHCNLV